MDPAKITSYEIASMVVLMALLIAAMTLIIRHTKTPASERISTQNFVFPLIAGLAMLDFIMINLLGADILDSNRSWSMNVLITVLLINLPLAVAIVWVFFKPSWN